MTKIWILKRGISTFGAAYLFIVVAHLIRNWNAFIGLPLNAQGDYFAGAFGPLALFAVLYGVLQQSEELKMQREELSLQRKAVQEQAAETAKLASAMQIQTEILLAQNNPSFTFTNYSTSKSKDQGLRFHCEIANHGKIVQVIAVSVENGNFSVDKFGPCTLGANPHRLTWQYPGGHPTTGDMFKLVYFAHNGSQQENRFKIVLLASSSNASKFENESGLHFRIDPVVDGTT